MARKRGRRRGATGVARAKRTTIQKPFSEWRLDFANASCAMVRAFCTPEQPILLELRRFGVGSALQVSVAATEQRVTKQPFRYRFGSKDKWRGPRNFSYARFGGDRKGVVFAAALPVDPVKEPDEDAADGNEVTPAHVRKF